MHKTTKDLQAFYDSQAEKFSGTRQRDWPEFSYILEEVEKTITRIEQTTKNNTKIARIPSDKYNTTTNTSTQRPIRILELGCGDGRFLGYLQDNLSTAREIEYTGVDISLNLLTIANNNHPHARRVHQDMVSFLKTVPAESFDVIIGIASFHHLPTKQERDTTLGFIYYALQYEGALIMTNRCYSDWFKEKFKKPIQKALLKSLYTLGKSSKNDIMVPWKDNGGSVIADRLYHIFGYRELGDLLQQSSFTHVTQFYIKSDGSATDYEREGRNLFSVARKSIWE